jgi:hypothetical protein
LPQPEVVGPDLMIAIETALRDWQT